MVWLPRNAQKCIFFTPFSPFFTKIFFFSKIRLCQFFGTIESYLDAKNQKKLWSGLSGIHPDARTHGRTDGRTHGRTDRHKSGRRARGPFSLSLPLLLSPYPFLLLLLFLPFALLPLPALRPLCSSSALSSGSSSSSFLFFFSFFFFFFFFFFFGRRINRIRQCRETWCPVLVPFFLRTFIEFLLLWLLLFLARLPSFWSWLPSF